MRYGRRDESSCIGHDLLLRLAEGGPRHVSLAVFAADEYRHLQQPIALSLYQHVVCIRWQISHVDSN